SAAPGDAQGDAALGDAALGDAAGQRHGDAAELSRHLDRVAAQYGDMTGALPWCRSAAPGAGLRLAVALGLYWQVRGPAEDGCRWFGELLEAGQGNGPGASRARLEYGALLCARGEFSRARAEAEEALDRK